jgi:hypothetical protein
MEEELCARPLILVPAEEPNIVFSTFAVSKRVDDTNIGAS